MVRRRKKIGFIEGLFSLLYDVFKNNLIKGINGLIEEVYNESRNILMDLKKSIFRSVIELLILVCGILFFLAGLILLLSQYFSLDYILMILGVIFISVFILFSKLK